MLATAKINMAQSSPYHFTEDEIQEELKQINAAKANPERFGVLYNKYHEQIFMFIYQRVESMDLAGDLASQVFLKAMQSIEKYEYRGVPFASWLYRIARNEMNQYFRKSKSTRVYSVDSSDVLTILKDLKLEQEEDYKEEIKIMLKAIKRLPDADIEILELRYFEERPFQEVGEIMGITENNAKVRVYRALDKLRKILLGK